MSEIGLKTPDLYEVSERDLHTLTTVAFKIVGLEIGHSIWADRTLTRLNQFRGEYSRVVSGFAKRYQEIFNLAMTNGYFSDYRHMLTESAKQSFSNMGLVDGAYFENGGWENVIAITNPFGAGTGAYGVWLFHHHLNTENGYGEVSGNAVMLGRICTDTNTIYRASDRLSVVETGFPIETPQFLPIRDQH